jgi:hypothetical protein
MTHENYLVTINIPTSLEEAMVDCLLSFENYQGFSSFPVAAYNHRNQGLSLAEQVYGRQRKIGFQMYADKKTIAALLTQLKADFSGTGLQYWVAPIIERGEI